MVDSPLPVAQMTPDEFIDSRRKLAASVSDLARIMNFGNARTIRRYEDGETLISGPASVLMKIFVDVPGAFEYAQGLAQTREEKPKT